MNYARTMLTPTMFSRRREVAASPRRRAGIPREFTKGGLAKGVRIRIRIRIRIAICAFPLRNCNALGSVARAQIERMPDC